MSSFRSVFDGQKAAWCPGWEERLMLPSSMNPSFQSIAALQSLSAATSAQQVKIHLVTSCSTEDYPSALPWRQDEGGWPFSTLLGIPTWYFCCHLPHPLDAGPVWLYIDGLCWGALGLWTTSEQGSCQTAGWRGGPLRQKCWEEVSELLFSPLNAGISL